MLEIRLVRSMLAPVTSFRLHFINMCPGFYDSRRYDYVMANGKRTTEDQAFRASDEMMANSADFLDIPPKENLPLFINTRTKMGMVVKLCENLDYWRYVVLKVRYSSSPMTLEEQDRVLGYIVYLVFDTYLSARKLASDYLDVMKSTPIVFSSTRFPEDGSVTFSSIDYKALEVGTREYPKWYLSKAEIAAQQLATRNIRRESLGLRHLHHS